MNIYKKLLENITANNPVATTRTRNNYTIFALKTGVALELAINTSVLAKRDQASVKDPLPLTIVFSIAGDRKASIDCLLSGEGLTFGETDLLIEEPIRVADLFPDLVSA
jgi:hypothetical protein